MRSSHVKTTGSLIARPLTFHLVRIIDVVGRVRIQAQASSALQMLVTPTRISPVGQGQQSGNRSPLLYGPILGHQRVRRNSLPGSPVAELGAHSKIR